MSVGLCLSGRWGKLIDRCVHEGLAIDFPIAVVRLILIKPLFLVFTQQMNAADGRLLRLALDDTIWLGFGKPIAEFP